MARYYVPLVDPVVQALTDIDRAIYELRSKGYHVSGKLDMVRGLEEHHVKWRPKPAGQEPRDNG